MASFILFQVRSEEFGIPSFVLNVQKSEEFFESGTGGSKDIRVQEQHQVPLVTPEVAERVATSKAPGPQAWQGDDHLWNFPSITHFQARALWEIQQNILISNM